MADPQGFSLPVESGVHRADSDHNKHSYDSEHTHSNTTHAYAYAPTPASVSGAGSAPPNPSPPDGRLVEENPDEAPLDSPLIVDPPTLRRLIVDPPVRC